MKISVVTPYYNQPHHLGRIIESVRGQLDVDDEHLLFDDGSDIPGYFDFSLSSKTRMGVSHARNELIKIAKGDWIKFLDADDQMAPFALPSLKKKATELPDSVKVIVGISVKVVDGIVANLSAGAPIRQIGTFNPFLPSMTMVRKQALQEVGLFDERIEFEEDWDLWLKIHEKYGSSAFAYLQIPVCYYWINQEERKTKFNPCHEIEGMDVREYFRRRYGIPAK